MVVSLLLTINSKGSEGTSKQPFGGGSGGGVSITPIAFLIVGSSGVKTIHLDEGTHLLEKVLDLAPQVVDKIQSMMSKKVIKSNNKTTSRNNNQQNPKLQSRTWIFKKLGRC